MIWVLHWKQYYVQEFLIIYSKDSSLMGKILIHSVQILCSNFYYSWIEIWNSIFFHTWEKLSIEIDKIWYKMTINKDQTKVELSFQFATYLSLKSYFYWTAMICFRYYDRGTTILLLRFQTYIFPPWFLYGSMSNSFRRTLRSKSVGDNIERSF